MASNPIKINLPKSGMHFVHPSELKDVQYSLLVNGNIQSISDTFTKITNELSNILCTRFKTGFKVINVQPVISLNLTFFFLANPSTGESEIGIVYGTYNKDVPDKEINCKNCNTAIKEDIPLEQQEQTETCTYITYVNADCLDFDVNFPIRSWVKVDDCNVRLYFGAKNSPLRYIDYDDYQKEFLLTCPKIESDILDCDKIKIFKDACYPRITYVDVISGGQNTAGVYQFTIAYADASSNAITDYFFTTNPIPLGDNPLVSPSDPHYPVAKSIKLHIEGLNTDFEYINIVVLKIINNVVTPFLVGTFANSTPTFDYIYAGIDTNLLKDVAVDELLKRTPKYSSPTGVAESNGYLFWYGIDEPRTINLQPVINKLTLFWQTEILNEGDYKNPIIAANYKSALRDEVVPYSIEFTRTNAPATAAFHIPGRAATVTDLEDVTYLPSGELNPDVIATDICDTTPSGNPRWTVYNTATPSGFACGYVESTEDCDATVTGTFECIQDTFYQDINTKKYYRYYAPNATPHLTDEITDLCSPSGTFTCDLPPSGSCFDQLELNYPNADIISVECSSRVTELGHTVQIPFFNEEGNTADPGAYPILSPSGMNTNISCNTAINLASYGCSSEVQTSYLSRLEASPATDWYRFTAGQTAMIINLVSAYNVYDGNNFVVNVYKIVDQNMSPCAVGNLQLLPGYPTTSPDSFIFIDGLIQGDTYYITVTADAAPTEGTNDYYYICQTVPIPSYYETDTTPNVLELVCTYTIEYCVKDNPCTGIPYEKGLMSYWESSETYPCNAEVWGDLAGQPIRHHKFPDCAISPHYKNNKSSPVKQTEFNTKVNIYPIGVVIDVAQIKQLLIEAVNTGLITEEERASICGYRILRGNRRGNESIIAKGLLYDVWKYPENVYKSNQDVLYPNYPYNPTTPDVFNRKTKIRSAEDIRDEDGNLLNDPILHPYYDQGYINNKYTFHSPNTHFNNPGLGNEIKLELESYGISEGRFSEVRAHAKYQYTGVGMFQAAWGFSAAESFVETVQLVAQSTTSYSAVGTFVSLNYIFAGLSVNFGAPGIIFSHYYEWLDLLQKFAPFRNYAWYYTSIGNYSNYSLTSIYEGNRRRLLKDPQYLNSGILSVKDGIADRKLNNIKRESSVYLNLNPVGGNQTAIASTFAARTNPDNSRWFPGDRYYNPAYGGVTDCDNLGYVYNNISSYYGSIKNQLSSQYGQITNVDYIDTGYNGVIDWNDDTQDTTCDTVFGGDTFINRFYLRTQFPFFLTDAVGYSPNSDIVYSQLGNVGYPQFYMNYPTSSDSDTSTSALYGNIALQGDKVVDYNFACADYTGEALYQAGVVTGVLSAVAAGMSLSIGLGVTYGVVKTNIENTTDGHAVFITGRMFLYSYGAPGFICESDYNLDLRNGEFGRKEKDFYPHVGDMVTWTQPTANFNLIEYDNTYLYQREYSKENRENPNYSLRADFEQEKEDCKAVHQNRLIYSLQDNDNNDRFDGNLVYLPNNFYDFPKSGGKVTLVFGSNNSKVIVLQEDQCSIFNSYISTQNEQINQANVGSNQIFNRSIPSQYIKTDLGYGGSQTSAYVSTEFGSFWVDNKRGQIFNYGQSIDNIIPEENAWWFKENLPFQILKYFPDVNIDNPYKYFGMAITYDQRLKRILFTKKDYKPKLEYIGRITFDGLNFNITENGIPLTIFPTNETYFCDVSWTIGYAPLQKEFISFYTFTPNYYLPQNGYFASGINYSNDDSELGLWNHNLSYKSWNVFYGKLSPFIFEYAVNGYSNNILESISYRAEFRRYTNQLNYAIKNSLTFDKALIWNQNQTSGMLNLVVSEPNNLYQLSQYPKQGVNSTDVMVKNVENYWRFNQFHNIALNNGHPIVSYECSPVYPEINPKAVSYEPTFFKNKLRNDFFSVRLYNTKYSNYQTVVLYNMAQVNPSNI